MLRIALFTLLSFLILTGCKQKTDLEEATVSAQANYVLTDSYSNHRVQQKYFTSSGGKIAYVDNGSGKTLVLLHGVPTSSWLYRKMIPELQKHYRVIAPDFLGYGSSDKPKSNTLNYKAKQQATYIRELLQSLGVQDYQLVFHDMGGLVGWNLLDEDIKTGLHKIKKITLLNTIISKQGFNYPKMDKGMMAKQYAKAFSNDLSSDAALNMTFKNMGLSTEAKLSENECKGYVFPMKEGSSEALYDFFTGFNDQLFKELNSQQNSLKKYQGTAQVLWGAKDKVLTTAQFDSLKEKLLLNDSDFKIYDNNAHFLPEEIPEELVKQIINPKVYKKAV